MRRILMVAAAACGALVWPNLAAAEEAQIASRNAALETTVNADVDATWNRLISHLGGRDYEINALVKHDRIIRVLFQSETPSLYVDCGEISVHSRHSLFGDRNYNFPAASSVRYLVADEVANELVDVERRTSLNALANIQLVPTGAGTLVRVDALYVMKIKTREFGNNVTTRKADEVVNFDSTGRARATEEIRQGAESVPVTFECGATGALERKIVSALGSNGR